MLLLDKAGWESEGCSLSRVDEPVKDELDKEQKQMGVFLLGKKIRLLYPYDRMKSLFEEWSVTRWATTGGTGKGGGRRKEGRTICPGGININQETRD